MGIASEYQGYTCSNSTMLIAFVGWHLSLVEWVGSLHCNVFVEEDTGIDYENIHRQSRQEGIDLSFNQSLSGLSFADIGSL